MKHLFKHITTAGKRRREFFQNILVFDNSYVDDNPGSKTGVTERSF